MPRYIDADKADVETISCFYGSECRIEDVEEWLNEQPTADVVPRDEVAKIFEEIERNIFILETPYQPLHCIPSGFIEEIKAKYTKGGEG